ncbi:hypothetical protein CFRS1_v002439 [Colletotrichum fructicola]|nr:hypothetical protein CFRS1_v002439 [Colletotrichum fructicola]
MQSNRDLCVPNKELAGWRASQRTVARTNALIARVIRVIQERSNVIVKKYVANALTAINEHTSAPRDLIVSGIPNAQRQTSPTESQETPGTTIQLQETDTTSNHSSSGVSETKLLYSQAERLLAFSMEVWFQANNVPGRHVMETALKQVRTATGTTPTSRHAPEPGFARSKPYPSVELIDSILTWRPQNTGSKYIADLQSVISLPNLEAQWLALRNGQAKGPLRNHYIVSVNYAAWCFIGIKMAETTSGDIHKHMKSSKRFYEQNIIYGLQRMSVADLPTTALFQALLSGAMFAFNVGCFERAWTFKAAACRVYESLPHGDSSVRVSEAIPAGQSDTQHAVELCYILDKTLSQIMDRAPSLGPGRIPKTTVPQDSIGPVQGLYNLFSGMAEVQDAVVRALRHPKNSNGYSEQIENLERTVHELRGDLEKFRSACEADPFWPGEAAATSYAASAIMASVLQLDLSASTDPLRQNELLAHARDSLRYLLSALSYLSTGPDGYAIRLSISWKLLFYPMNSYFTLYAFMLAHNDVETYLLLSEITQGLLNETWDNEPFSEFISLLSSLMGLASKMFSTQSGFSQRAECQVSLSADGLTTARLGPLVLDGAIVEEELFSHPIEWNEEGMSLADSLALMVDWDVPEVGGESHSNN